MINEKCLKFSFLNSFDLGMSLSRSSYVYIIVWIAHLKVAIGNIYIFFKVDKGSGRTIGNISHSYSRVL